MSANTNTKVQWENGKIMNINSRHYKNWAVVGEEE